jgi:hypothetical protein
MSNIVKLSETTRAIIEPDLDSMNPRTDWNNLFTFDFRHRSYDLGDKGADFHAVNKKDLALALPVYAYEHSGITISLGSFSCTWDSGILGMAYITKETVKKEFGWMRLTKKRREHLTRILNAEIETYDNYLTGAVYLVAIQKKCAACNAWEYVDSCGGFFGSNHDASGLNDFINEHKNAA